MIDTTTEQVLHFRDAVKLVPRSRGSKPLHRSAMYRWSKRGCKGVRLEAVQVGGSLMTTAEALARFFERLTAARGGEPAMIRTPRQRERATRQAEAELQAAGY